jgi:DNA invertase Pin-like site-specific DNA recombinase
MFFNILATFAEFEVDLLRLRTREGMAVARQGQAAAAKTSLHRYVTRQPAARQPR